MTRTQLLAVVVATAIVVTACGSTPDAEIAVNVSQTTITEPDAAAVPASSATAEEVRADFIAAATDGDMERLDVLLAAAEPGGEVVDMLAAMMEQGVNISAGDDDCTRADGCYVFTDWFQAFLLEMEPDVAGNWSITGISLQSTD